MVNLESIKFIRSPNFGERGPNKPSMIILHCPVGTMKSALATFQNIASRVSAHYVVDRDGSIVQMVPLEKAAWHAMHIPNLKSIGIEIVDRYLVSGYLTRGCMQDPGWYTKDQLSALCDLVAKLMIKFDIPLHQVMGHNDPSLRKYGNNHQDPGPFFPWRTFKELVPANIKAIQYASKPALPVVEPSLDPTGPQVEMVNINSSKELEEKFGLPIYPLPKPKRVKKDG